MDWNEVKAKPKRVTQKKNADEDQGYYGGMQGGHLKSGAVYGGGTSGIKKVAQHHASTIAEADYLREGDEEIKYELVSHVCAAAVQAARLVKDWSQAELAKKVNEKTGEIIDLENGSSRYNADLINRIEKALGVKIPRGRKNKRH